MILKSRQWIRPCHALYDELKQARDEIISASVLLWSLVIDDRAVCMRAASV